MNSNDIEKNIHDHANALGVSPAKLKAIYARGVKECMEQGYDGPPSIYGLARVQRFVVASQTGNYRITPDAEFAPTTAIEHKASSYEITDSSINGWDLIYDVMSEDGKRLAEMFPPGSVEQTVYDKDTEELAVLGTHNKVQWSCTLNLSTGESTFISNDE